MLNGIKDDGSGIFTQLRKQVLNVNLLYLVWTEVMHRDGGEFPGTFTVNGQSSVAYDDTNEVLIQQAALYGAELWLDSNTEKGSIIWFITKLLEVKYSHYNLGELTVSTDELISIIGPKALTDRELKDGDEFPENVDRAAILRFVESCISSFRLSKSSELREGLERLRLPSYRNGELGRGRLR